MKDARVRLGTALVAIACLTGCGDDDGGTTQTSGGFSPAPQPNPAPAQRPESARNPLPQRPPPLPSSVSYPLDGNAAYQSVLAGAVVAGRTPNGAEVQIAKSTITEPHRTYNPNANCHSGYDYGSDTYTEKCGGYELQQVPRTVYSASGPPGQPTRTYDNIAAAFQYAAQMHVSAWRLFRRP